MRILLINNFFRDVGGVERVFFAERALLRAHGHEVIDFSTQHEANHPSYYADYFVSGVDFQSRGDVAKKIGRLFCSHEVSSRLTQLIRDTRPDVAHIHGMFDLLGPSVAHTLARHGVPIVFTTHAYKLICPSGRLCTRGEIDETCRDTMWRDVFGRAVQDSVAKSFVGALALRVNQLRGTFRLFDHIIAPSQFLIRKHAEFGFDTSRFVHLPNPIDVTAVAARSNTPGRYMLCASRLVLEKGIDLVLDAASMLRDIPIKIVGDGPDRTRLQARAATMKLAHVSFEGHVAPGDVDAYVQDAAAVVVPSVCYETDPYSVLEGQAAGRVVIGAYTGGIPEQIQDGETGFLFERGNAAALADVMRRVWNMDASERRAIGVRARAFVDTIRNPELYYEGLMDVVGSVKKH